MYITDKERTTLLDAIDFIRTNADGATDQTLYDEMCQNLNRMFEKASHDIRKRKNKKAFEKALRIIYARKPKSK